MHLMKTAAFLTTLVAGAVALPGSAYADDTQYWQQLSVNVGLFDNFRLNNEFVARTSEARGFYEFENSTLIGYKFDKHTTLWLGYVHNPTYTHGDFVAMERRFRQQLTVDNFAQAGKVKFSARLRNEFRWRDGISGTGWRVRPYVKASMPLVGKTTLTLSHESFVNLNTTTFQRTKGYDRMRNAVSVGIPVTKGVSVDVGYLNQHTFVRNAPDTDDHVLTTGLSLTF